MMNAFNNSASKLQLDEIDAGELQSILHQGLISFARYYAYGTKNGSFNGFKNKYKKGINLMLDLDKKDGIRRLSLIENYFNQIKII